MPNPSSSAGDGQGGLVMCEYGFIKRELFFGINAEQQPGYHYITWEASGQASGMYFYKITDGEFTETKKMLLLR